MTKAIRIHQHGGPEVMRFEEVEAAAPAAGEVRIRHSAIGLNFLDTYYRTGLYPAPDGLPLTPGSEGAGEVVAVGDGVTRLKQGDRVAYTLPLGAYAEERNAAADRVVKVPDGIADEQAAAMMLKGMTVEYLLRRAYPLKGGETVLFHAAAGGVGLIFRQWAKSLGVTLIGTAGSPEKAELARAHGYDHVIDYRGEDFVARVDEITGGRKCDVVYDSVGADTFMKSLDCLRRRGTIVSFGQSSGPVPPFNLAILSQKGSLYLTRPTLFHYIATRAELEAAAAALFEVVKAGTVDIRIGQRYALADAARAHLDLEGRRTTGATVLIP